MVVGILHVLYSSLSRDWFWIKGALRRGTVIRPPANFQAAGTPVLSESAGQQWQCLVITMDGMQIDAPGIVEVPVPAVFDAPTTDSLAGTEIDTDLLEISPGDFRDKQKIGRGSFGEVFRCQVDSYAPCCPIRPPHEHFAATLTHSPA